MWFFFEKFEGTEQEKIVARKFGCQFMIRVSIYTTLHYVEIMLFSRTTMWKNQKFLEGDLSSGRWPLSDSTTQQFLWKPDWIQPEISSRHQISADRPKTSQTVPDDATPHRAGSSQAKPDILVAVLGDIHDHTLPPAEHEVAQTRAHEHSQA